jgi:hypothetical protein
MLNKHEVTIRDVRSMARDGCPAAKRCACWGMLRMFSNSLSMPRLVDTLHGFGML